ncbi:MAG: hypothetical protein SOZ29_09775 [Prevotella sp.]|nr:hypothetical protein [Prevotella sp.]
MLVMLLSFSPLEGIKAQKVSKTFTACALNIDGLPQTMAGVNVNGDGPGSAGTQAIGEYIVKNGIDIVGCSEDFNYNGDLVVGLGGNYHMGLWRGRIDISDIGSLGGKPIDTDGLMFLLRNTNNKDGQFMSFYDESWTQWNESLGGITEGANTLVKKGYRFYTVNLGDGVKIDVYVLHMNTAENKEQFTVQDNQLTQLAEAVAANTNGRPKLIIGDTNCRYTRNKVTDNLITPLSELYTIKDVWVEKFRGGNAPDYTPNVDDDILVTDKTSSAAYETGEIVDKIFYLVPKGSNLSMTLDDLVFDADNYKKDGTLLGDHVPVIAKFTITGKISYNDLIPASQSDFWKGEEFDKAISETTNNGGIYIYNVGSGFYITGTAGSNPSVNDINYAEKWGVHYDSNNKTATISKGELRIRMDISLSGGVGIIKKGLLYGATDFTVVPSTITKGAYRFDAKYSGSFHHFQISDGKYAGAEENSLDATMDWLFISEAQKTAYNDYEKAYNDAKKLLTEKENYLNEEVALKSELEDILLKTMNTKYSNSEANTAKLIDIYNRINFSFTKTITVKAKYATICLPYNTKVPEGVTVKVVTEYIPGSHYVKTADFAKAGEVMPANNGFLLYAENITEDTKYTFVYTSKAASAPGVNLLFGNVEERTDHENLSDVFVLANKSKGVGFYHLKSGENLAANVAYLRIADNSIDANAKVFIDDSTTGVEAIETEKSIASPAAIYDTLGRQAKAMRRGVNIVRMSDGSVRKVIIK